MRRWLSVLGLVVACKNYGPKMNEAVYKEQRHIVFRGSIAKATFCKTCGRDAPVTVRFGDKIELTIPNCYAHAESKIGDHDKVQVELLDTHAIANAGELDITDCTTGLVIAKLWATFPDGTRVDADIDTPLTEP